MNRKNHIFCYMYIVLDQELSWNYTSTQSINLIIYKKVLLNYLQGQMLRMISISKLVKG